MNGKVNPVLDDFSLTKSGILYKLLYRLKLGGTSPKEITTRILVIIAITWLPLLVLATLQGLAFGNKVDIPFLLDFACHIRFLLIIPLLIFAEISVDQLLRELSAQFFKSGILDEKDLRSFDAIKKKVTGLTHSYWADILILLFIAINLVLRLQLVQGDQMSIWFFMPGGQGPNISWGGMYYGLISMPISQFIIFRWLWRWILWFIYFLKISKLPLKLNSAHPDMAGGIGFLGFPPGPFIQVVFAFAILFSTTVAEKVFFLHEKLPAYYPLMIGFAVISILMNVLPLLVFMKPLLAQRRKGFFEYSALIQEHHRQFDEKWLRKPCEEDLPGTGDASSMTDFNTSFDVVKGMKLFPFDIKIMVSSIVIAILPMLPLLAFEYNVADLMMQVLKMLA
jgi:hypothetical protein